LYAHLLRPRIEGDGPAYELGLGPAAGAPHERIDAREQFLDVERFDNVVVRAELQRLDLVLPAVAGGEDQYRVVLALRPDPADDVDAREAGKAEVDDRDVDRE